MGCSCSPVLLLLVTAPEGTALSASGGANLWRSSADRDLWYRLGKAYWETAEPTNDGVMAGVGPLHDTDIADSYRFLTGGASPLWPHPTYRADARALDIGAGIGRVSGALLLKLCGEVDLVDGSAAYLERARASLSGESPQTPHASHQRGRLGQTVCSDLQSFVPRPQSYDLVWVQWTTMFLTDDDLRRLLADCQRALTPNGLIVLKDNVIDEVKGDKGLLDGRYIVDEVDASVSRTRQHLLELIQEVGLSVVSSTTADLQGSAMQDCLSSNGWVEMHPVAMLALR